MDNELCRPCESVADGVTLRCWNCKQVGHIHSPIWRQAETGDMIRVVCPNCVTLNIVAKPGERIPKGHRLVEAAVQLPLESRQPTRDELLDEATPVSAAAAGS